MTRLVIAALSGLVVAGCAGDDGNWVVRPPGGPGGPGGTGTTIDAAQPIDADGDARGDGGGDGLRGQICVVTDLRAPDACPAVTSAAGVLVRRAGDATGDTSDAAGRFTLDVAGADIVLDVASGSQLLQPSIVPVLSDGTIVHAPVPTASAWSATVAALPATVAPGAGSIAVYTVTAAGTPAAGVIYELPEGAPRSPFYDGTGATPWTTGGGTGPTGTTLIVDLPPGTYVLEANQGAAQITPLAVPVYADAVTFVRARLPPET